MPNDVADGFFRRQGCTGWWHVGAHKRLSN
jgi:hypothetical protein